MILPATIDEIKDAVRIEDVIGDFVTLRPKGRNLWACCPFHGERTPSFSVSPARGIFKCFGCGKGGDAIAFLKEKEGMDYPAALRYIAAKYGIQVQESENGQVDAEATKKMQLRATAGVLQAHFSMCKEGELPGLAYWRERGFTDATLDEFGIGHCDGSKPEHVPDSGLSEIGAINEKGNLIFYRRSTIPLHDRSGNVIGWAGRLLEQDDTKAKYINGSNSLIYNKSTHLFNLHRAAKSIRAKGEVWIVEGYADVMAAWQSGITNVVGLCGTALTDAHVNQLKKFNGDTPLRIVLALDNEITKTGDDEAGKTFKASVALAYFTAMEKLLPLGEVVRFIYPKGKGKRLKDMADVVAAKIDPETCEKKDVIEDYVERRLAEDDFAKKASAVQIADFQHEVARLIGLINRDNVRTVYINRLANIIKTGPRDLDKMVKEMRTEAETEEKNRAVSEYRYIKVGDEYYQRIIDYDIFTQTSNIVYRRRKRQELVTEGISIGSIPRFHDWIILPSHTNYQRVFEKKEDETGEMFRFFNSYNPLPHKPKEFQLPEDFLSDPENFDYEKIPEIRHTAALMKHLFDFETYGNKQLSVGWDWIALCYLKPTQRQRALCLVSTEEGTGKSTFINLMLAIFGQNATKTEASRIGKDFNAFTAGKVIQCVEETKDERGQVENKLKDLIASFDKVIEPKHQDARVVKSFDKYIFASNHEDSFMKVGHGTTRFIVVKVNKIKEKIVDFEDKLYLEIPYLLYFLQKRGIVHPCQDRFWHRQELIENEALLRLRQSSKDNVERNIEDLMEKIFLSVTPTTPILSFTSGDIMKMMVSYAGRAYEQKTVNYFQDVCVRMGCIYTKSTRRKVYKIEGLYAGGTMEATLSLDTIQGKFLEFPIWKFCDPEQVHEFYPADKLAALIAACEKETLTGDAAGWLENLKSFTAKPAEAGEDMPF